MKNDLGKCECGGQLFDGGAIGLYCEKGFHCPKVYNVCLDTSIQTVTPKQFDEAIGIKCEGMSYACEKVLTTFPYGVRIVEEKEVQS